MASEDDNVKRSPPPLHTRLIGLIPLLLIAAVWIAALSAILYGVLKLGFDLIVSGHWIYVALGVLALYVVFKLAILFSQTRIGGIFLKWVGYALMVLIAIAVIGSAVSRCQDRPSGRCIETRYMTC